jgi:hypothetical protein
MAMALLFQKSSYSSGMLQHLTAVPVAAVNRTARPPGPPVPMGSLQVPMKQKTQHRAVGWVRSQPQQALMQVGTPAANGSSMSAIS